MVAVECRSVEAAVRLDRAAILAEFDDIFSHNAPPWRPNHDAGTIARFRGRCEAILTPFFTPIAPVASDWPLCF
jgi:hypothetical protein